MFQPLPPIVFLRDAMSYATILPRPVDDTGTWDHLAVVTARVRCWFSISVVYLRLSFKRDRGLREGNSQNFISKS